MWSGGGFVVGAITQQALLSGHPVPQTLQRFELEGLKFKLEGVNQDLQNENGTQSRRFVFVAQMLTKLQILN